MKEIKCLKCATWNADVDFCVKCGAAISSKQLNLNYRKQIDEDDKKRPPSKIDVFLAKKMQSPNIFVKSFFYFLYSIWVVYLTILGFFLYLVIGTPG